MSNPNYKDIRLNYTNQILTEFPIYVNTPVSDKWCADMCDVVIAYEEDVQKWLRTQIQSDQYIAYPCMFGEHSHKSNGVHFRYKKDAMLFKLTCL